MLAYARARKRTHRRRAPRLAQFNINFGNVLLHELMTKLLTKIVEVEDARRNLSQLLDARGEWFLRERRKDARPELKQGARPEQKQGARSELKRGEWEVSVASGALIFSYRGDAGARFWRIRSWRREGEKLLLDAARRAGAERARLELVPRALNVSAREAVADARHAECERLAALFSEFSGAKVEHARLSSGSRRGEPGRWARVILRRGRERFAATAPVVTLGAEGAESFLSSALLWLARIEAKPRAARVHKLFLVAPKKLACAVGERLPLLRDELRRTISLFEVEEDGHAIRRVGVPALDELLDARPSRLFRPSEQPATGLTEQIVALAPDAIDVAHARHGETLRFKGLPFARVRRLAGREHAWFGTLGAAQRRLLDEANADDLFKLVEELKEHRRAEATDRRHALYRAAPEAWLEALLRRDITRLDPGLRLAPLHAQFRASRESDAGSRPVDLLALRRDGRLAVVELKVSEDASLALQGADYWRRVETQRRCGNIARARLFGDAEITDEPPLVYLVAPMLRFHRSFATLARAVTPRVEMYRFDLNEDWRAGVRVVRRCHVNQ